MSKLTETYRKIDERIRKLSRTGYAVLIGLTAAAASLATSTALGEPDFIFSTVIGLVLAVLNYIMDTNEEK